MRLFSPPLLLILCLLAPFTAHGGDALSPEDQLEFDRLMGVLDKHTDIATFTKMNADYTPGMVTVLQGRDLEARGKRNVMEALTLVPGLDISLNQSGTPSMTSRGIGSPYLPATSLIMLDGVSMNSTTSGTGSITFGIPIEQIERIEVIRGPGTSVNGEFAYNSVINIITRQEGNTVHTSYGRFQTYSGGGIVSYDDNQAKFSLNMATTGTDGADQAYGPDNFGNYGNSNEDRELDSFFGNFQYHNFSIAGSYIDAGQGEFFDPYPNNTDEITSTQQVASLEAQQLMQPMDSMTMVFKLGWLYTKTDIDHTRIAPPGFTLPPPFPATTFDHGINLGMYNEEEKIFTSLETTWKATPSNTVTAALNYNHTQLNDTYMMADFSTTVDGYIPTPPLQKYTGDDNFMDEDATRNHVALALQDEYHLNKNITVMAGLRYDHYSDVADDQITPRISGVWQPSEHHIFKLQYAKAFRPPTFMELTGSANFVKGNDEINAETIDTYELGYIYRKDSTIAKVTLFYSDLDDLITIDSSLNFSNDASATQTGVELEFKQDILNNLVLDTNISYATTNDDDTHTEVVNSRNWLVNLGLTFSPCDWSSINTQYRYVDQRQRAVTDVRDDLQDYDVVDVTLSFFPQMLPGLTMRTGLKNVFAAQAYVASGENPFSATDQAEDFQVLDRFWWIQATYNF
jgi:outer membrane receptor for ferrienterochelin and colicins